MALHSRSDSIQTHHQILHAACVLALHAGPHGLTIDGVAKEAGMSKGGVLYHFPSKESLMLGLMKLHLSSFWEAFHRHWKADSNPAGRWHRSWIKATFEGLNRVDDLENAALFATISSSPELLGFLRRQFGRLQRCLELDALDPHWSRLLVSAIAGLRYDRLFHFCPATGANLQALESKALEMLEQILLQRTCSDRMEFRH